MSDPQSAVDALRATREVFEWTYEVLLPSGEVEQIARELEPRWEDAPSRKVLEYAAHLRGIVASTPGSDASALRAEAKARIANEVAREAPNHAAPVFEPVLAAVARAKPPLRAPPAIFSAAPPAPADPEHMQLAVMAMEAERRELLASPRLRAMEILRYIEQSDAERQRSLEPEKIQVLRAKIDEQIQMMRKLEQGPVDRGPAGLGTLQHQLALKIIENIK